MSIAGRIVHRADLCRSACTHTRPSPIASHRRDGASAQGQGGNDDALLVHFTVAASHASPPTPARRSLRRLQPTGPLWPSDCSAMDMDQRRSDCTLQHETLPLHGNTGHTNPARHSLHPDSNSGRVQPALDQSSPPPTALLVGRIRPPPPVRALHSESQQAVAMYDSSSPGGSSSKHFVWAWGRLTPAPLLLTTSNELPLMAGGSGIAAGLVGASNGGTATPGGNRASQLVRSRSAGPDDSAEASSASAPGGGGDGERDSSHSHIHSHSHAAAAQCTLSPTLIEAMETNSVRAVHTAAHHTVAITRTNKCTLESGGRRRSSL